MVFSSIVFIFLFLPITIIGYYVLRNKSLQNTWLLIMSLVFFAWSQMNYLWIILASIVINYLSAMAIAHVHKRDRLFIGRALLFCAIVLNLVILFYFKYFDFALETINAVTKTQLAVPDIVLPIGISFFTFQGMSYVIDVFRNDVEVQRNPLKVALYIVLFPQLIAGPIVRYTDIAREIDDRETGIADFSSGISRFVIGLGKKAIIANTMAQVADSIWKSDLSNGTVIIAWVGSIAYSLQIYYDFSGYSDMAIGIGRMFGFHFQENFNRPYISSSITEFWKRWHISLSSWFRDYVYIPLGGNRKHLYRNLIIVFLLTGLWHGASWHFVIWGVYHGLFMLIERVTIRKTKMPSGLLWHVYALFVVNIGWVLFRADNFGMAIQYIGTMFGIGLSKTPGFSVFWYVNRWSIFVFVLAILEITGTFTRLREFALRKMDIKLYSIAKCVLIYSVLLCSISRIMSGTYNPFIYFQF